MVCSSWLFALFIAIDANFRLKLKARGIKDPELGSGWAYFVEQTEYEKHVRKHFTDVDVRTISTSSHIILTLPFVDRNLWINIPRSKSSPLKVLQGLLSYGSWSGRLRTTQLCPEERRRRFAKGGKVRIHCIDIITTNLRLQTL